MRSILDEQLSGLNAKVLAMAALVRRAVDQAIDALALQDTGIARRVIAEDDAIDNMEREIEALCLRLLLRQQPVAGDLRQIAAALKMIADFERIGDHAVNIAEAVAFAEMPEEERR